MFADETGGEIVGASPEQVDPSLNRLVDNIAQSYTLAYSPTNSARDGKRRRVRIELSPDIEKREGQVAVRARHSYVVPKEAQARK